MQYRLVSPGPSAMACPKAELAKVLVWGLALIIGRGHSGNLLRNAGFELSNPLYPSVPAMWTPLNPPPARLEFGRNPTQAHAGQRALRLAGQAFYQSTSVEANEPYTFTAFARNGAPNSQEGDREGGTAELSLWVNGCGLDHVQQFPLGENWQRFRLTVTPKGAGGAAVRVGVFRGAGWVDDVQFESGVEPTPFVAGTLDPADAALDVAVDPFQAADRWQRWPEASAELRALLGRKRLSGKERSRLRNLGDHFLAVRDDWRALLAYERWLAVNDRSAERNEVEDRVEALRSVLRRRAEWLAQIAYVSANHVELQRATQKDVNFPFVEALEQRGAQSHVPPPFYPNEVAAASSLLEAALDQVYYYPWESQAILTLFAHGETPARRVELSITDLRRRQVAWRGEPTLLPLHGIATVPIPLHQLEINSLPERRYRLEAVGRDARGRGLGVARMDFGLLEFHVPPAPAIRTLRLREDGVLLINEQPFLPLGIWDSYWSIHQQLHDRLADMAAHGFNLGPASLPAVRHPYMLTFASPRVEGERFELPAGWGQDPNLFGWHWWDEPFYQLDHPENLQRIRTVYRALRSLEPWRPVLINGLNEPRHYEPFARVGDIFAAEPYDVGLPGVEYYLAVADRARQQAKADHPIALWSIPGLWRHPTPELVRAEAYTALLHGARGLYWYAYETDANPRPSKALQALQWNSVNLAPVHAPLTWSSFRGLTAELRHLSAYVTSADQPLPVTVTPPQVIQAKVFRRGGKGVMVAVAEREPIALGKWEWREMDGVLAHRGQWGVPGRLPRFFASSDLPAEQSKALHGLVNLEPVTLAPGDVVEQEVWCAADVAWISLRPVVDGVVQTYWIHPILRDPVRWEADSLRKGQWVTVSFTADTPGLVGQKVVGFYFDNSGKPTWWGRTWMVRDGKRRLWFDHGTFEWARRGRGPVRLTVPAPLAGVRASVLFEPRLARASGNTIEDCFAPGSVHCYAVEGLQ